MPVTPDFARLAAVVEDLDSGLEMDLESNEVTEDELRELRSLLDAVIVRLDQIRSRISEPQSS